MQRMCCVGAVALLLCLARPAGAVTAGQVSNFQDGTTQGWVTGPNAPLPSNVATGGPAGAGDKYLEVDPFIHLAFYNASDWSGNYASAGITDVGIDFMNPNPSGSINNASLRIVLFGPSGSRWASNNFIIVPPDSVWHHYMFSLRQADLTQVVLGDTYAATMANADRLMFRQDGGATPSSGGSFFNGTLGVNVDNITAIAPEPSGVLTMVALCGLMQRRSR